MFATIAAFVVNLIVNIAIQAIAYLLMPKPKTTKPAAAKDMDGPTNDAGREIPVIWGTMTVKGLNILWYGDKNTQTKEVSA